MFELYLEPLWSLCGTFKPWCGTLIGNLHVEPLCGHLYVKLLSGIFRDISGANMFNKGNTSSRFTAEFNSNSAKLHVAIVDEFLQLDFISLMFHLCQDHWTSMPSDESDEPSEPLWTNNIHQPYSPVILCICCIFAVDILFGLMCLSMMLEKVCPL